MRQIYKYDVTKPIMGRIEKFLHLDYQDGEPMVWAIVDDSAPVKHFSVICSGTGWPIADFQNINSYLGTLQDDAGYVWHYFVVPTKLVDATGHSYDPLVATMAEVMEASKDEDVDSDFDIDPEQVKILHEKFMDTFLRGCRM